MNLSNDAYQDDRMRSDRGANFLDFIDVIKKLWEAAGRKGKITRNYTKEDVSDYPIITYHVVNRAPHPAFKEVKPRPRQTLYHPTDPNKYEEILGQKQLVCICFTLIAQSDDVADELMFDFEDFLFMYRSHFMGNGVSEMLFNAQGEDTTDSSHGVSLSKRKVYYDVTFDVNRVNYLNQIDQLAVKAGIQDKLKKNKEGYTW